MFVFYLIKYILFLQAIKFMKSFFMYAPILLSPRGLECSWKCQEVIHYGISQLPLNFMLCWILFFFYFDIFDCLLSGYCLKVSECGLKFTQTKIIHSDPAAPRLLSQRAGQWEVETQILRTMKIE